MTEKNFVFETSWEVCNKNGGIYTVLSTHAKALKEATKNLIFIGPDFGSEDSLYFKESNTLLKGWKDAANNDGLGVRIGTWNVPGEPTVILINFNRYYGDKDAFFGEMWEKFGVDSLGAVGDYHECATFGMAAGRIIEHYASYHKINNSDIVAHFHEWQVASGLLYLKSRQPDVKTVFTTHATTTGRSICFNGKNLYQWFEAYNGDQMAAELGVKNKHSIEKAAAVNADVFSTVSALTAKECKQLLTRDAFVLPNGFEGEFVPKGAKYTKARKDARTVLKKVTEALIGYEISDNALFVATSGRFEWRNKGIDVFVDSLKRLNQNSKLNREVVAFVMVPSWVGSVREDLSAKLNGTANGMLIDPIVTHNVNGAEYNEILNTLHYYRMSNNKSDKVKVVYVPCLLDDKDGILNMSYYDLLPGLDLTVFASYYEPWGYTPLESAAFGVPTITTDLAGFGLWVSPNGSKGIENGVAVLHRDDTNREDACINIEEEICKFASLDDKKVADIKKKSQAIAESCSWDKFVAYYVQAYNKALGLEEEPVKSETKTKATTTKKTTKKVADTEVKATEEKSEPKAKAPAKKSTTKKSAAKTDDVVAKAEPTAAKTADATTEEAKPKKACVRKKKAE